MKQIMTRVSDSERKELKTLCAQQGISLQDFIYQAIEEYRKKWVV